MNKALRFLIASLIAFPPNAIGQASVSRPSTVETISSTKNYVKNPSANKNTGGVSATNATITRDTTAANKIDGVASFSCDTSALNGFCEWTMNTIQKPDDAGNCEASAYIKGDGSLYSLQLTDGTSALATVALANQTSYTQFKVYAACGSTRTVRIVQSSAGTSPAISIGRVYYGPETAQASSPAGSKNYLGTYKNVRNNGDFETGALGSWVLGNVALTSAFPSGTPTFGSGANASLSQSIVSSSPLSGSYSYAYTSSAATTAGNFLSSPVFTIDQSDQSKVLTFKFNFKAQSNGSNANWSGTSSNSFGVAIYDVTNATWIMPAGVWALTQSSGVGVATGTFQTAANSSQFRLVVFNANATSGAVTLYFDDFSISPQTTTVGAPVTDWQAYTPTFSASFGTTTGVSMYWRRVGGSIEIQGSFKAGSTTGAPGTISLPNGYVVSSNLPPKTTAYTAVGNAPYYGIMNLIPYWITAGGETTFAWGIGNSANNPLAPININAVITSGTSMSVSVTIPIQGWSSQVQMSDSSDTRVIAARMTAASSSVTVNTAIPLSTVAIDTAGAATLASGRFTAPASGFYSVSAAASRGVGGNSLIVYKNGSLYQGLFSFVSAGFTSSGSTIVQLNAGDYVDIRCDVSTTISNVDFSVTKINGPSQIAASETVHASYWLSANFTASPTVPINFDSREIDSHGAVQVSATNWRFVAPISGVYSIQGGAWSNQGQAALLYKNGSVYKAVGAIAPSSKLSGSLSGTIRLNAGDYIDVRPDVSGSVGGGSLGSFNTSNISITKIGN